MTALSVEKSVVGRVVDGLLTSGYTISLSDGTRDRLVQSSDREAILAGMLREQRNWLVVYESGSGFGWIRLEDGSVREYTSNLWRALHNATSLKL
ncbi:MULTISPECIES: hypothetical protein [unclassified Mesorhizobium]|uniref:hypothetical protein n=1 Tax=unclassified Mesorhizobium TaxID=325217 RepID=UPI000FDA9583|nr:MULTISPECIES: hypothetical protein [unclassified Mesorhizobium]TGR37711.1 hypothetical protein EN842_48810 [bacterium M00.F.Ca.ET.199.01.1.1]TGU22693.1 hypothetical protein EN799_51365 [bacterium M00.F.Ca.ET.156.01.1.1]TGV82903.1 hypothetical protein EN792_028205 [Mesorhizobium sp. M00.F.Ca.ET.149.01.1.1]TGR17795.1 hypothetical protein EN845_28940 [Mesorhizobium sp. M8A.F.Ca.ET.202.01.1.1]TGR19795.1 hypothetical protein EN840_28770 [Mesorhizobium sp. M8A.F.Ca.ET.197.01.1.1]